MTALKFTQNLSGFGLLLQTRLIGIMCNLRKMRKGELDSKTNVRSAHRSRADTLPYPKSNGVSSFMDFLRKIFLKSVHATDFTLQP